MDDFRGAISAGTVPELLNSVPAVPGRCTRSRAARCMLGAACWSLRCKRRATRRSGLDWIQRYNRPAGAACARGAGVDVLGEAPAATRVESDGDLLRNDYFSVRQVRAHCEEGDRQAQYLHGAHGDADDGASLASKSGKFAGCRWMRARRW